MSSESIIEKIKTDEIEINEEGNKGVIFDFSEIIDGLVATAFIDDRDFVITFGKGDEAIPKKIPLNYIKRKMELPPTFSRDLKAILKVFGLELKKGDADVLRVFMTKEILKRFKLQELTEEKEDKIEIVANDGFIAEFSGFVFFKDDEWIAAEPFIGWIKNGNGEAKKSAILVVSRNGEIELTNSKIIPFADTKIEVVQKGKILAPLQTLITKEAVERAKNNDIPEWREVFEKIREELLKRINFVNEIDSYILAGFIISTYFTDITKTSPIIRFAGLQGSGKTRAMKTTVFMSRRGFAILDPSEASLFRSVDLLRPTIGIDEEISQAVRLVLKGGYKKGLYITRVAKKSDDFVLELFDPFTPYVLSVKDDRAFDEQVKRRMITVQMIRNPEGVEPKDPSPEEFEKIREDCYVLRLKRPHEFKEALESVQRDYSTKLDADGLELWQGILAVARLCGEDVEEKIIEEIERRKIEWYEETFRDERLVIDALIRLKTQNKRQTDLEMEFGHIREEEEERDEFYFEEIKSALKEVYLEITDDEEERKRLEQFFYRYWNNTKIGRILKDLGLESYRDWSRSGNRGRRVYKITDEILIKLCKNYYPDNKWLHQQQPCVSHTPIYQNHEKLGATSAISYIQDKTSKNNITSNGDGNNKSETDEDRNKNTTERDGSSYMKKENLNEKENEDLDETSNDNAETKETKTNDMRSEEKEAEDEKLEVGTLGTQFSPKSINGSMQNRGVGDESESLLDPSILKKLDQIKFEIDVMTEAELNEIIKEAEKEFEERKGDDANEG